METDRHEVKQVDRQTDRQTDVTHRLLMQTRGARFSGNCRLLNRLSRSRGE